MTVRRTVPGNTEGRHTIHRLRGRRPPDPARGWESFGEDRYRSTESWDVDVVYDDAALGPTVDLGLGPTVDLGPRVLL